MSEIQKNIGFGDYCSIEQKRYAGPNEFYGYKVVGRKKSNVWTEVPVDSRNDAEVSHDHIEDVVTVVCNNLDDRTVHQFRVSDLSRVQKARATPKWVNIKDSLPPKNMLVLAMSQTVSNIFNIYNVMALDEFKESHITHWMTLPDAPQELAHE